MESSNNDNIAFNYIRQWEQETINRVKQVADQACLDIQALIDENNASSKKRYDRLDAELRQQEKNNSSSEQEIEQLKAAELLKLNCQRSIEIHSRTLDFDGVFQITSGRSTASDVSFDLNRVLDVNSRTNTVYISDDCLMTASHNNILYYDMNQLCIVDLTGTYGRTIDWMDEIRDMCWCSSVDQFFIWSCSGGYTLDSLTLNMIQIKEVPKILPFDTCSATCLDDKLLLCDSPNIQLWQPSTWTLKDKWENVISK
ncbi:unnamed protein product, partial [Didymodactylos carnosus]